MVLGKKLDNSLYGGCVQLTSVCNGGYHRNHHAFVLTILHLFMISS